MTSPALHNLMKKQAEVVAENWHDDPAYYSDAESWVEKFWNPELEFRPLFDKLDPNNIVELACGHGRHSWKMRDWRNHITLVDIVQENIDICRIRFDGRPNVDFITNEGTEFPGLLDATYSSIFCYDAMVHFDHTVVFAYLVDSARILKKGGMALFHHSNSARNPGGDYRQNPSWRNFMPRGLFADYTSKAGLMIVEERLLDWGGVADLDALTLVRKV